MSKRLYVKYPLFLTVFFMKLEFSRQMFDKTQVSQKSPSQWEPNCSIRTGGETDMKKLVVAFLTFANAPKNTSSETVWRL